MSWLDIDALDAVRGADTRDKTAGEALTIAADYLRRREPLPPELADYLAGAFEMTAAKDTAHQGPALLRELGIEVQNRRPVNVDAFDLAIFVDVESDGKSERKRILAAAERWDVSESTVRGLLPEGRRMVDEEARDQALHNIAQRDTD